MADVCANGFSRKDRATSKPEKRYGWEGKPILKPMLMETLASFLATEKPALR